MTNRIRIVQGDITRLAVDAIVNAANNALSGGGGVDGAIHRAAGPELLKACRQLGWCPTGRATITPGFRLPAKYVIHTVGPVWQGGDKGEADLLSSCYLESLALAAQHQLKTIAFPAISTGVYGYPLQPATQIAYATVSRYLENDQQIEMVTFVCFDQKTYHAYQQISKDFRPAKE